MTCSEDAMSRKTHDLSHPSASMGFGTVTETADPVTEGGDADARLLWGPDGPQLMKAAAQVADDGWTPALVRTRLKAATKHCARTTRAPGPVMHRPSVIARLYKAHEDHKTWGREHTAEIAPKAMLRLGLTPAQVSQLQDAIHWPARYVADGSLKRRVVLSWMQFIETGGWHRDHPEALTWDEWAKLVDGVAPATAKRHRTKACSVIAVGLTRDGVKP